MPPVAIDYDRPWLNEMIADLSKRYDDFDGWIVPKSGEYTGGVYQKAEITPTALIVTANYLYAFPLFFPCPICINELAVSLTIASAGTYMRCAAYDSVNNQPGVKLTLDTPIERTPTGTLSTPISNTIIGPGVLWFTVLMSAGTAAFRANPAAAHAPALGCIAGGITSLQMLTRAYTYGAMPKKWGTPDRTANVTSLRCLVRIA